VVVVVGDFETKNLFAKIRRYFENIPRQKPPRPVVNSEPPQRGEKRILYHRVAELPAVMIAYRGISYRQADDPALNLLALILSHGQSARLYRRLVYEKQIATTVSATNDSRIDPGLFTFYAQAQQSHTAAQCEAEISAALEEIQKSGVTERELQKAKNIVRAGYVHNFKTNFGRAGLLANYQANWGDWRRFSDYLPRHDRVTTADIQRVARRYFTDRARTVVTLVPQRNAQTGEASR
jgi:predicted Zn-dependent peptidase